MSVGYWDYRVGYPIGIVIDKRPHTTDLPKQRNNHARHNSTHPLSRAPSHARSRAVLVLPWRLVLINPAPPLRVVGRHTHQLRISLNLVALEHPLRDHRKRNRLHSQQVVRGVLHAVPLCADRGVEGG